MPTAAELKAKFEAQCAERVRLETEAREREERELHELEEQEKRVVIVAGNPRVFCISFVFGK